MYEEDSNTTAACKAQNGTATENSALASAVARFAALFRGLT